MWQYFFQAYYVRSHYVTSPPKCIMLLHMSYATVQTANIY